VSGIHSIDDRRLEPADVVGHSSVFVSPSRSTCEPSCHFNPARHVARCCTFSHAYSTPTDNTNHVGKIKHSFILISSLSRIQRPRVPVIFVSIQRLITRLRERKHKALIAVDESKKKIVLTWDTKITQLIDKMIGRRWTRASTNTFFNTHDQLLKISSPRKRRTGESRKEETLEWVRYIPSSKSVIKAACEFDRGKDCTVHNFSN